MSVVLLSGVLLSACASPTQIPLSHDDATVSRSVEVKQRADLLFHLLAGEFAVRNSDFPAAFHHYLRASQRSGDPEILKAAFSLAMLDKNYADAVCLGERWRVLEPDNLEVKQRLAVAYVLDRRFEDAMLELENVIGKEGIDESRIFTTLMPIVAKDRMKEMAERFDDNARAQYVYAAFLLDSGDYGEVARLAGKATTLDPTFANAYLLRGWALILDGQADAGIEAAATAVEVAPDDIKVRSNYAQLLLENERPRDALREFRIVHESNPQDSAVVRALGLLSLREKDFTAAAAFFQKLGAFPERRVEALYYGGRVAEARGEMQKALEIYRSVPQGEFFKKAKVSMAEVYRNLGDLGEAVKHLEAARTLAESEEEKVEFYLVQGRILAADEQHYEAIGLYTRAMEEHGAVNSLLYARALAAAELGLLGRAEADLERILHDDPDNTDALNSLGYVLADHNVRLDEAKGYILRAHKLQPDDPAILDSLGWVEFRLRNVEVAEALVRRAMSVLRHPDVLGHLSEILCLQRRVEEAEALVEEGIKEFPDDDYLQRLRGTCNP